MPRSKPGFTKICHYPGCPCDGHPQPLENFPISVGEARRRYCKPCYRLYKKDNHQDRQRCRRSAQEVEGAPFLYGRVCSDTCPEWARCTALKLWAGGPVPCELLLPDEIGQEYESGELTLWRVPMDVTLRF